MEPKEIKEYLESNDIGQVKDALYFLFDYKTYDSSIVKLVVDLVTSSNRGVQSLAIDCLKSLPDEFRELASAYLVKLIESDNIEYRNIASDILSKYGDVCYDYLKPYLHHPIADVRQFALDIWGNIASKKDWNIVRNLLNDSNKNVVISAIIALGNIKVNEVVNELISKYMEDDEYKPFVLNSLGKIGGENAREFILDVINNSDELLLQLAAIDSVSYLESSEELFDTLLAKLPNVPKQVQPYFLKAICNICRKTHLSRKLPDEMRQIARDALKENDIEIRKAALLALGDSYDILDVDSLIYELIRFDSENMEMIFSNIIHNSSVDVFSDFIEKLTYQKDNGEIFSALIEFFFREWDVMSEDKKVLLISLILNLSEELPETVLFDFCDWFAYREPVNFKTIAKGIYDSSSYFRKAKIEDIASKYELF